MEIQVISTSSDKKLAVLEVNAGDTISELKEKLHLVHEKLYPARVAFRTAPRGKNLPDDAVVSNADLQGGTIYFKDLGPQVGWTTVFLTEYAGPLVIYLIFFIRPTFIYGATTKPMAEAVRLAMVCHTFHYAKRLLETLFVHRFSKGTMPIMNIFRNSAYYWGFAGWMSYFINHPLYTPVRDSQLYAALIGFIVCELGNLSIHIALKNLRPAGTKIRAIPRASFYNPFTWLFSLVSCPNYTYETGAWLSFALMTQTVPAGLFMLAGAYQMSVWALGKHRNYRKEFRDYPRGRKAIYPFLL